MTPIIPSLPLLIFGLVLLLSCLCILLKTEMVLAQRTSIQITANVVSWLPSASSTCWSNCALHVNSVPFPAGACSAQQCVSCSGTDWMLIGDSSNFGCLPALGGPVYIVSSMNPTTSPMCLSVANSGTANGSPIVIEPCAQLASQLWYIEYPYSSTQIMSYSSGRCLDLPTQSNYQNGAPLQIWDCLGGDQINQFWYISNPMNYLTSVSPIQSLVTTNGAVLTIPTAPDAIPGAPVQIWSPSETPQQEWQVQIASPISFNTSVYITSQQFGAGSSSNQCLTVYTGGTADGTSVVIENCIKGAPSQMWIPRFYSSPLSVGPSTTLNAYQFISAVNGRCLDIWAVNANNGAVLDTWDCLGTNQRNQLWKLSLYSANNFALTSLLNGFCLDIYNGLSQPGTPVQMWTCNNNPQQKWAVTTAPAFVQNSIQAYQTLCLTTGTMDITVAPCTGDIAQQWYLHTAQFTPPPPPSISIGQAKSIATTTVTGTQLRSFMNDECVGLLPATDVSGYAPLKVMPCDLTNLVQSWTLSISGGYYRMNSNEANGCISVAQDVSGTVATTGSCTGATSALSANFFTV